MALTHETMPAASGARLVGLRAAQRFSPNRRAEALEKKFFGVLEKNGD
jgi:hypothetical protein